MSSQGSPVEGDGPDVDGVSVLHTFNSIQVILHLLVVKVLGGACKHRWAKGQL